MTPSELRAKTIVDRIGIVRSMLDNLREIPLGSLDDFDTIIDPIMTWLRQNPEKLDTEI